MNKKHILSVFCILSVLIVLLLNKDGRSKLELDRELTLSLYADWPYQNGYVKSIIRNAPTEIYIEENALHYKNLELQNIFSNKLVSLYADSLGNYVSLEKSKENVVLYESLTFYAFKGPLIQSNRLMGAPLYEETLEFIYNSNLSKQKNRNHYSGNFFNRFFDSLPVKSIFIISGSVYLNNKFGSNYIGKIYRLNSDSFVVLNENTLKSTAQNYYCKILEDNLYFYESNVITVHTKSDKSPSDIKATSIKSK